ncbi:DUF6660 family protein [Pedobacter sp.]
MTLAPCMDSSAFVRSGQATSIQSSHEGQSHSKIKDACSPFCMCACCSVPTSVPYTTFTFAAPELPAVLYTEKTFGKATSAELSVWQPPRLG